jgi:undecaprenyl-diphosphatase
MHFDDSSLDRAWFYLLNAGSHAPGWLDTLGVTSAIGLIYLVPVFLVVAWLWGHPQGRSGFLAAFIAIWLGVGINQLIGLFLFEPRPFMLHIGRILLVHSPNNAFPSDHVTVLTALAVTLLLRREWRSWGAGFVLLAVVVGWARVFVGVHWPFDILGAFGVGTLAALITAGGWRTGGKPVTRWVEGIYRRVFAPAIARGWIRG